MLRKDLNKAYMALALVSFFWGTTYLAAKIGARNVPGLFVAGIRQFMAGAVLVSFFLVKGYKWPAWEELKRVSVQSIFLLCLSNGLISWSVEYISSGLAAIIAALVPLFIVLFSALLSKCTRITKWMLLGFMAGFAGVLTIFYDYLLQLQNRSFLFGVILALLYALSWSFGTVYTANKKPQMNLLFNVGLQMLIAGVVILVICGVTGKYANLSDVGQESWLAILYLVVFGSLLTYSAYVYAIAKLPATQVSIYAYINPVVAVLLGWLLLSEKMNINIVLGTMITLCGVYLVNREFKKARS